jgi:hypothetical protein
MTNPANPNPTPTPVLTHSRLERCEARVPVKICGTDQVHVATVRYTWNCGHHRYYCDSAALQVAKNLVSGKKYHCPECEQSIKSWVSIEIL